MVPALSHTPIIITNFDFLRIVFITLKYHIENYDMKNTFIKQSFIELCCMYRSGIQAYLTLQLSNSVEQQQNIYKKITSNSKLIIYPQN